MNENISTPRREARAPEGTRHWCAVRQSQHVMPSWPLPRRDSAPRIFPPSCAPRPSAPKPSSTGCI